MLKRLVITLLSTGCLIGAYGLYALWVTPFVQRESPVPKKQAKQKIDLQEKRGPQSEISTKYLPGLKWSWDAPFQMHDGNRYIFTERWERKPEDDYTDQEESGKHGEIEFTPFAMVVLDDDPDETPYTLISRSAVLQFEHGFEGTNFNPGRVVGGSLNGEFEIRGPKGLMLRGHNFVFQENPRRDPQMPTMAVTSPLAWSDDLVTFEYDGHYGTGHGLELKLIPASGVLSKDKPAVDGIETIRLRDHVEMHLLKKSDNPESPPEPVQINSDGPFVFDMISNTVTFSDVVNVIRRTENGNDTIDGDVLHVVFREVNEEADDALNKEGDDSDRDTGNLAFSRLRVTGEKVVMKSQHNGVTATMQECIYDGDEKQVVMNDGDKVWVRQKNTDFYSPELTLNHDDDNKIISILGRGAGYMTSRDPQTGVVAHEARWQKQIWKRPDETSDQQVLDFQENARLIEYGKTGMGIEAEVIRMWLDEQSGEEAAQTPAAGEDAFAAAGDMKIQRLLARTNVAFAKLPELWGTTQKLEVWFEDGKIPRADQAALNTPASREPLVKLNYQPPQRRRSGTFRRQRTVVGKSSPPFGGLTPPGGAQALASTNDKIPKGDIEPDAPPVDAEPPGRLPPPQKKVEELNIFADRISVRVIREGDEHHVSHVVSRGNVSVTQEHDNGDEPLSIDCHELTIHNQDDTNEHHILWVKGIAATDRTPAVRAHVRDRGMHLEGQTIKTDRLANQLWVPVAGLMELPVSNTLDGRTLQTPELLSVWWNEKMEFDGLTAQFFDNVRIVHEDSTVSCGQMDVTFENRISFAKDQNDSRAEPKVRRVVCRDGVHLEGQQFEGNLLIGKHRGEVFELTMDQVTGDMVSSGGGWLTFWRRDNGAGKSFGPPVATSANRSVRSGEKQDWNYTKITFRGEMTGNISSFSDPDRTATTTFHKDVFVVHGPVKLPTQTIDPDELPEMAGTLESDILQLRQLPPAQKSQERYITMLADGNARMTGRDYSGRADMITFDQSKNQYTLRTAAKRGLSELWISPRYETWNKGRYEQRRGHTKAREFTFNPETGERKVIGGVSADGQN